MKSFTETEATILSVGSSTTWGRTRLDGAKRDEHFEHLLAVYGPALSRLAASYTNTLSDRDDLLQEIAVAVWQALPRFRGESSERTFVYRIAHNRAITYLARARGQTTNSSMRWTCTIPHPVLNPPSLNGSEPTS
jgi:DNA-directed RNA polymerase specialized sigma24 family protein